jgi:hypothetical protein
MADVKATMTATKPLPEVKLSKWKGSHINHPQGCVVEAETAEEAVAKAKAFFGIVSTTTFPVTVSPVEG